ncbi:response regulator [Endobacterium cereale]|uniref:response regulator n=1 Tax=Endobacterium cereale TaxID=2663029 RepID=UPI002B461216|nr:response regulator [Endobacterium cereale]MEB2848385.1 response regulator [Endobacterium cereale]
MSDRKRILVVEDEWLLASELSRRLRSAGHDIVGPAPTVKDAMRAIEATRPHAAILDVRLDGETTLALAKLLVQCKIPVLFLSGHSAADFSELGDFPVITKPADWGVVLNVLQEKLQQE